MRFSVADLSTTLLVLSNLGSSFADCNNPIVRKEWRALTKDEQQGYISAVRCLKGAPAKTRNVYSGVRSRFDDFQAVHINRTDFVHFVGFFQAWHRMFLAKYESELRSTCGYKGAQPYWDWTQDATSVDAFVNSPVFDPVHGFGGNGAYIDSSNDPSVRLHIPGKTGGGCIKDGPFKDLPVNLGPGFNTSYNPHCLRRDFAPEFATQKLNQSMVDWTMKAKTYFEFDKRLEGGIDIPDLTVHGGGHLGVGGDLGEIGNVYSSPGDPLFYLHHANMDRLWYTWQKKHWPARKKDIGGPDTQFAYPFNFFGDVPYKNVTLDYLMDFGPLMKSQLIGDVMDTEGEVLCYNYA